MLAQYHSSPDARVLSLPLKTNSTIFETSHFVVELEKCQTIKDTLPYIRSILRYIETIYNTEERKRVLSNMKTEIEHTVQSTDIDILQEYLHTLAKNNSWIGFYTEDTLSTYLFYLIAYHVLVASENENSTQMLNFIKVELLQLHEHDFDSHLDCIFQLYLDVYYKDNPNDIFTNIHTIWKCDKATELNLKLAYCKNLMEAKRYKTLIQLIHHHADYFIESFELITEQDFPSYSSDMMVINVLIHILHHQGSLNNMEKVNTVETIILRIIHTRSHRLLFDTLYDHILKSDNKQILGDPHIIKLIQHAMKKGFIDCNIRVTFLYSNTLGMKFVKCFSQIILSISPNELMISTICHTKKQYCMILLILLDIYVSCHDTCNINLVLMRLLEFRVSLLSPIEIIYRIQCYCFMGEQKNCKHGGAIPEYKGQIEKGMNSFQRLFSNNDEGILLWNNNPLVTLDSVIGNILLGKEELALYLQRIKDMMEMEHDFIHLDEISFIFFMKFIKRTNDHNAFKLYDIIKILCTFDLQPEIQDILLSGLTEYLIISCNRQYGMLSKFILDINMICLKGQFLQKLTSSITKVLLKFNDDTVNDIKRVIYHCYCTLRHDSKNEKDANIEKYKDHYTFIASMEVEEEMEKLKNLTNVLLMLTLLLIASGGHHKSAELKKYLSLKYEYRDSILYLLWCSGDVEINPGPTLSTLRKVPDSVKERNWIYEMSSMLVRLLKYKSIDIRIDGLWKERPLDWPVDTRFYDPRNKPKGKGYSIKTDRNLLGNLKKLCDGKKIFQDITQLKDEHTKSKVKQYKKEITAWRKNKADLFELYILRQELDILLEAKTNLQKYKKEPEIKEGLSALNVDLIYDSEEDMCVSNASYTDIVRDLAITFCRIGKGLNPLQKSDNLWQMPPSGWCHPKKDFFSPCNAGQRRDKCTDKELVQNLLSCCETKIEEYCTEEKKPVLIKLINAWKHENVQEVRKYHTIWSNIEVIDHSLKYLKLEGLLAKSQTHLEKLGIKPRELKESIQHSTDLSSCPIQDKQTNQKCPIIIQSDQENHFDHPVKLRDADASQKVVPLPLMGRKYQETDPTTQNNTIKRKHQSTDENYTEPKKLHGFYKGKSSPLLTSSTEQCQGEPINDQTPITVLDDILDLQDESNLNKNSSSFNIPIQDSSSTTDQSSDLSNELPEYVQLYIDTVENSYNPDDTLNIDIDQFIEELDMDSS